MAPDIAQPQSVSTELVSFSHPGNWTVELEESTVDGVAMSIHTLNSPSAALVVVCVYDRAMPLDVAALTDRYLEGITTETGPLGLNETDRVQSLRRLSDRDVTGLEASYTLPILGLEVPHTLQVYTVETASRSAWVVVQAPDDERALEQPGIELVLDSVVVAP